MSGKAEVRDVNHPGRVERVDAARSGLVRDAMPASLPREAPGVTAKELRAAMPPQVEEAFPGGAKLGWWETCVRLDLEARGLVGRSKGSPLRFRRT